jgi:hypothetical protein
MSEYDFDLPPLTRPCAGCGVAERYLSRRDLCDACEAVYSAEMELVDQMERDADDHQARSTYYGA